LSGTQVDRSCHRISQDLPGKMRESQRILPESIGSCWNPPKKIREIPDRNTASNFLVFSVASPPFPAVRRSPGYVVIKKLFKRVDL
jgi:hypothetical protein